ncbi:hypothetical protein [Gluconobacter kondonii]|nr:hypothetical protein [Gluconobacter kondonii]
MHLISMLNDTPPEHTHFRDGIIRVLKPILDIPLYESNRPRFTVVVNNTYGTLVDAMAIRLSDVEAKILADYGAFSVNSIASPAAAVPVTMAGFPGIQRVAIPEVCRNADIVSVSGENFSLSEPSAKGFSGGPVYAGQQLLGVNTGDTGNDKAMTSALAARLDVLKPIFFA